VAVAVLFPGQGSQLPGMADPWASHDVGRAVLDEASAAVGYDLLGGCRDDRLLATTGFVQPALLACDIAAFRVLEAEGVPFGAAAGHSLGEFAALVATGMLELTPALEAVVVRGRAMQLAAEQRPGTMTAVVGIGREEATEMCEIVRGADVLAVANENASNQVVLSGTVAAVERAEEVVTSRGAKAIRLKVAGAFHSPLMQPAVEPIREALSALEFREPRFPIVANLSGRLVDEPSVIRELLERHVISPVRWERSMHTLAEVGFDTFVEAGPGRVLTNMVKREMQGVRTTSIGSPAEAAAFARRLAEDAAS
jgi:[acyl-carrier-protein] S-malonyltransferase